MPKFTLTDDINIAQVGQSWVNANREKYIFGQLSQTGKVLYRPNGVKDTVYQLPAFDNSLHAGNGINWEPGDSLPEEQQLDKVSVTVTPQGRSTRLLKREALVGGQIYEDLENNISNILLSQAYQVIDKDIVSFMTTAANYGQITFSGTGALDTFANDQTPYWNLLNSAIAPLRLYAQSFDGLEVEMWLGQNVLDVFMSHWNFQGAGATVSAIALPKGPMVQSRDQLLAMLSANLRVKVRVFESVSNTANFGATATPAEQAAGLCWIGVVDQLAWDITEGSKGHKPDGAIQVALAKEPEVDSFVVDGSQMETFRATYAYQVFNPRGTAWGKLFPVGEIIT